MYIFIDMKSQPQSFKDIFKHILLVNQASAYQHQHPKAQQWLLLLLQDCWTETPVHSAWLLIAS